MGWALDRRPSEAAGHFFALAGIVERRRTVQIKLFEKKLVDLGHLETEINQWLAANPKAVAIQRDLHVFHSHATREENVLVALWYEPKSGL
jgi:hypothetical protein